MNILILTHSYPDKKNTWRGSFIQSQARVLCQENDVTLVYFRSENSDFSLFRKYRVTEKKTGRLTEYTVTVPRFLPVLNQLKFLLSTYRFVTRHILRSREINLINCHLSYPAGFLGSIIRKKKGIPVVLTEHSLTENYFRSYYHKKCVIYALNKCSHIIAVSNFLKRNIGKYTRNNISVVPNVVDVKNMKISEKPQKGQFRAGILGGYNNNGKGLDILIRSVAILKNEKLVVHVGGDGSLLDSYKKLVSELSVEKQFVFHGKINPPALPGFYSLLDFFILPSRSETFGVVLVEAMSCGIPVIASKCGGPEEIVTESSGFLVEKEDPHALATAIDKMVSEYDSFNRHEIREYANSNFGSDSFMGKIKILFNNVLNKEKTS